MSLYGALYSSVSGINAQSTAIGIISDNISNVNTVGYKAGSHYFSTLVTNSGSTVAYSPGGVKAQNRQLISQQGLIQSTNSPLDIAVSGNGFFVVQDGKAANAATMYTRAGSFRKDDVGNFVNAAGLYLKAWPVDGNGNIPTANASPDTLKIVDIGSASGNASSTTTVKLGVNLNANENTFKGAGDVLKPGAVNTASENLGSNGNTILVPNANLTQGDLLTVTVAGTTSAAFEYGGIASSVKLGDGTGGTSTVFNAQDNNDTFTGATDSSGADVSSFTMMRSGDATNPITLKYVASGAVAKDGTFSTLDGLRDAINAQTGFEARVVNNKLYIAPQDASEKLTFTDTHTGTGSNFVTALGLSDTTLAAGARFATMEGLAAQVNKAPGISAAVSNTATKNASLDIHNIDPLTKIQFSDSTGSDKLLSEFGLNTTAINPSYDPAVAATSMASGSVPPAFVRTFSVYDSQGHAHDVKMGFLKVGSNTWRSEIYVNPGETTDDTNLVASGEITFNGDGTLGSTDFNPSIDQIKFNWSNGASQSNVAFDLGTSGELGIGKADGMRQFSGTGYNVYFVNRNGAESGLLDSVSIDKDGFIIANYNNGQTQKLYKIPLADFQNPDGLQGKNGNAFIQTFNSGEVNLKEAGKGGVGSISPSSLEAANTELSQELTDMIVAQRAYQASAKVIKTAADLLDELNHITN